MKLREGKYQFIYNVFNGDVRIYDIFYDGRIKEQIARTGVSRFVSTEEMLDKLDVMIRLAEKEANKFRDVKLYGKIKETNLVILRSIKEFALENYIEPSDIRSHW